MIHTTDWQLPTRLLGRRVIVYESTDSTNNRALELSDDAANDGVVILAHEQTAGRGQHGRRWQCGPGDGVLLSVLLFPPAELRRPVLLAAWAAVAVCSTIGEITGLESRIKWPNDVLVQERKVCGVLIEQGKAVVAGIGLNVNQAPANFADAGLPEAGSLASLAGRNFDVYQVATKLIEHLDSAYALLLTGRASEVEAMWRQSLSLLGRDTEVASTDGTWRGRLRGISFESLELEVYAGSVLQLIPERVRQIRAV